MRFLYELWIPIVVSSGFCFVWSAIAWAVLPHHKKEWKRLSTEPDVLAALRKDMPKPGQYQLPFSMRADLKRADTKTALETGPVGFIRIGKSGVPNLARMMGQSVLFYLLTTSLVASLAWYVAPGSKLGPQYLTTFRVVATTATMAYVLGAIPESIWFARPWKSWFYQVIDGAVMGLMTAAIFGWLWPK